MYIVNSNPWWLIGLKGLLALIIGIIAFARPDVTIVLLVTYTGFFVTIAGALVIIYSFFYQRSGGRNAFIIEGIMNIIVGVLLIAYPKTIASIFIVFVGIWALLLGLIEIATVSRLKDSLTYRNTLLIKGIITALLGVVMIFSPFQSGMGLTVLLGVFAIVFGLLTLIKAIRLSPLL